VKILVIYFRKEILFVPQDKNIQKMLILVSLKLPLLYAGILLEGGIVSYDSNIITGGFGARYFGTGELSYRQDRVTIYLRMVSTSNGKILKSVYISKTILSQAIDQSPLNM
jgi:curli biogenesis system outer membrane secretion channel CsgG